MNIERRGGRKRSGMGKKRGVLDDEKEGKCDQK